MDGAGNVYVADTDNRTIRKITPAGAVSTLAGQAGSPADSADGTGSKARFSNPFGIAVDNSGNIYVVDANNHTIRKGVNVAQSSSPLSAASPYADFSTPTIQTSNMSIHPWCRLRIQHSFRQELAHYHVGRFVHWNIHCALQTASMIWLSLTSRRMNPLAQETVTRQ